MEGPRGAKKSSLELTDAEVRDGRIYSKNKGVCAEDAYPGPKVHLGSGAIRWPGWLNVDLRDEADLRCDLRKLDLPTDYADAAAAIHVLEHFYVWEAPQVLREWRRILKPGGKLILELPCLDKVLQYIARAVANGEPLNQTLTTYVFWGDVQHHDPAMCHRWGYTMGSLRQILLETGFEEPVFEEPRYHFPVRDMRAVTTKPRA